MKKITLFITVCLIGFSSTAQKFSNKGVIPGSTVKGLIYLTISPIIESATDGTVVGVVPDPFYRTPIRGGYVLVDNKKVPVTAATIAGPSYSLAWKAMLNTGAVTPHIHGNLVSYTYDEDQPFTCYRINILDEDGKPTKEFQYEIEFPGGL